MDQGKVGLWSGGQVNVKSQEFSELDIGGHENCFTTELSEYWPHHSRLLQPFNIKTLLLFKKKHKFS